MVLVPLDTSRVAEQALPHAIGLARRARAKLQLVCVRPSLTLGRSVELDERYLARLAARLAPELPQLITHRVLTDEVIPDSAPLESHRIAGILSRHARERGADIIVMATHGRGGVRRAWLGSVADWLVRIASRPVVLIRPQDDAFGSAAEADRGIRHIVIGLDGSAAAEQVIAQALNLGSVFEARYSLVRVTTPSERDGPEAWSARAAAYGVTPPMFLEDAVPPSRRDVADGLERAAASMRERGVAVTTHVLEELSPGDALVHYATENGADAIALGTGCFGGVRRLLLGSVTDRVLRTSEIPVLVCRIRRSGAVMNVPDGTAPAVVAASSWREK